MSLTPPLPGHSLVPKVQYLALGGLEGDSSGENTEAGFQECEPGPQKASSAPQAEIQTGGSLASDFLTKAPLKTVLVFKMLPFASHIGIGVPDKKAL